MPHDTFAAPVFRPAPKGPRAAMFWAIAGAHLMAVAALVSTGAVVVLERDVAPMVVRLMPAAPRPALAAPAVPMPKLRPPEIRLPSLPPVDAISIRMDEAPAPSLPKPAAPAPVQVAAVSPSTAPSLEPPSGDMAYLNNPAPAYPSASKRGREQGRVLLRVRVDEKGQVEAIEVQSTSGFARLDDAAMSAVRRWRFVPARLGDRTVAGWALVPINFTLSG